MSQRRVSQAIMVALLGAAAAGAGCTEKGRSIVLVNLTSSVTPLDTVKIVVAQGTNPVGTANPAWDASKSPNKIGVYVDKNVSGTVTVVACGFVGKTAVAASGTPDATTIVSPGADSPQIDLMLAAGTPSGLCAPGGSAGAGGTGGSGGQGGTGTGGTMGAGGTAGMGGAGGNGGSIGGGGGTSGAAGSGGASGSGGTGGRGGSAAGTGGNGGQGGVAGSAGGAGGRGGAAGSGTGGGSGGRGGTGGSVGGTGGSAGSAGTGGKPPGWEGAMPVDTDPVVQARPSAAVDSKGNAVVALEVGTDIWASYYDYATDKWKWTGVDTRGGDAYSPRVAVDANGNYLMVWYQRGGTNPYQGEWYSTSSDGMAWSSPTPLSTGGVYGSTLAMNANGAAIAAWEEADASGIMTAYAATRPSTTGNWTPTQVLKDGDDTSDRKIVVAMSGTGEAFALWEQYDAGVNSIWMRQHTASGWGTGATQFESYNTAASYAPAIAANASGQVMATYLQDSGSLTKMLSRRYTPTTGFSSNVLQVASASAIEWLIAPTLTLDDAGIATAAFSIPQASGKWDVYTNRSGTGDNAWQGMMMMESDNDAAADNAGSSNIARVPDPVLAHDAAGNVMMVWRKRMGTRFDVWAQRYAGGWGSAAPIETRDTNSAFGPDVAVGANGTAVAVWYYGTELTVYANVFR